MRPKVLSLLVVVLAILSGCAERNKPDATPARGESDTPATRIVRVENAKPSPPLRTSAHSPKAPLPGSAANAAEDETSPVLSGKVTLPGGAPAIGARIRLFRPNNMLRPTLESPSTDSRETSAGTDGNFRLKVDEEPVYMVRISHPGYAAIRQLRQRYQPGRGPSADDLTINVELTTASRIAGRVIDGKGTGVPGVPITAQVAMPATGTQGFPQQFDASLTTSTVDGRFQFDDVPPVPLTVAADPHDFVPVSVPATPPADDVEIRLAREGAVIEGNVFLKATGEGVSSATVRLTMVRQNTPHHMITSRETQTDDLGAFRFERLPAGNVVLDASRGNELRVLPDPNPSNRRFPLKEKETTSGIWLPLYRGHTVKGTITEAASGEPVEGVEVVPGMAGRMPSGQLAQTSPTLSNASGFYQLDHIFSMWGNTLPLGVRKQGYLLDQAPGMYSPYPQVELPPDELVVVHNMRMTRGVSISGKVQNRAGGAVPGASLTIYGGNRQGTMAGETRPVSNRNGSFEAWSRPFCTVRLVAKAAGMPPALSDEMEILDKPVEGVVITVGAGASISGTVVDPDGNPVEGAQVQAGVTVTIGSTGFGMGGGDKPAKSDAVGAFKVTELPAGKTYLSAQKAGFAGSEQVEIALTEGENRPGVVVRMRRGFSISGKITDTDGNPVADAAVNASGMRTGGHGTTQTDSLGRYTLASLAEGTYNLTAHDRSGRAGIGELKGVETGRTDADIVLKTPQTPATRKPAGAKFTGTVVDWKTGQPIRDFTARCVSGYRIRRLGEAGKFEIVDIPDEAQVTVSIDAPGYRSLESESISISGGKAVEKTFKLGPGGTITGRTVRTGGGGPIAGVRVGFSTSENEWERRNNPPVAAAVTGSDGRFRLERTPVSKGVVSFRIPDSLAEVSREARPEHGRETDLGDVVLSTEGGIGGRVVRQPGAVPIPDVFVEARDQNTNRSKAAKTAADGTFSFPGTGVGGFTVALPDLKVSTFVRTEKEKVAEVLLEVGGAELVGKVTCRGKGVDAMINLNLQRQGNSHLHTYAQSSPDGEFRVPGLVAGEWDVGANRPTQGGSGTQAKVSVPAVGTVKKDFVLPGARLTGKVEDRDGKPLADVEITVQRVRANQGQQEPGYWGGNARSGSDGRFTVEGLRDGEHDVFASKTGAGMAKAVVNIPADTDPPPVTLSLGVGGGTLESTALSYPDGKPLPQATLSLSDSQTGRGYDHGRQRDDRGVLRVEGIPAGKYNVQVGAKGYSSANHALTIEEGKTATIEDVLYEAGGIRWRLIDSNGAPARNVEARFRPDDPASIENERPAWSNHQGVYEVSGLMPGSYTATATRDNKPVATAKFTVTAGQTAEAETTIAE